MGWGLLEGRTPSPAPQGLAVLSRAKPSLHSIAVDDGLVPRLHGRCLSMVPIHSQRDEQVVGLRADGS
jgi:hypothetical protein